MSETVEVQHVDVRSLIGPATLAHAMPGRIRFRLESVRGDVDRARQVEQQLSVFEFVERVTAYPRTGSVIVEYATDIAGTADVLRKIATALDVEIEQPPGQTRWPASSEELATAARNVLGHANARVARATGGIDLRILVPGALLFLGIGSLLGARRRPAPDWYTLLWYGFNIFERLNPPHRPARTEFTGD